MPDTGTSGKTRSEDPLKTYLLLKSRRHSARGAKKVTQKWEIILCSIFIMNN